MPAQVSKLIAKLRKSYPELQDEPMLDQLEVAAYGDDEAQADGEDNMNFEVDAEAAEVPYEDGEEMPSTDEALDFDMEKAADAMNMLEEAEGEDEEMPMPKRKRKGASNGRY